MLPLRGQAQDATTAGGSALRFTVGTELRVDDNLGLDVDSAGTSTIWDTDLGFGYSIETALSKLTFSGSGVIRQADLPGDASDNGFQDPRLAFGYDRAGATSRFSVDASWRQTDLRYLDPLADPIVIEDEATGEQGLRQITGTRERLTFGTQIEFGVGTPMGMTLGASRRETSYQDTNRTSYYDNHTDAAFARLRMDLTPVTSATVDAQASRYEAENLSRTVRDSTALSFGLGTALDKATTLSGRIGYRMIDSTRTLDGERETTTTDGVTLGAGVRRELRAGSVGADYSRSVATSGTRDTLRFDRQFELYNGRFGISLGTTKGENGDPGLVANVDWTHELKRGAIDLALDRSSRTDDNNQDVLVTQGSLNWRHDLNEANSVSLGASLASIQRDDNSGDGRDITRASLRMAWNREIVRDVDMSLGYVHRFLDDSDASDTADSNSVYLSLGKTFDLRP
ncbi:hypothetical protein V8J36_18705 [Frigidibacter sp. MR17.14]|uniref:hypothetical protein n=1 Tax=Frigidibacter sp. MR17.14 TaxID=3126509 RepID=UPI003012EB42